VERFAWSPPERGQSERASIVWCSPLIVLFQAVHPLLMVAFLLMDGREAHIRPALPLGPPD
jgi:hypothetical protein